MCSTLAPVMLLLNSRRHFSLESVAQAVSIPLAVDFGKEELSTGEGLVGPAPLSASNQFKCAEVGCKIPSGALPTGRNCAKCNTPVHAYFCN